MCIQTKDIPKAGVLTETHIIAPVYKPTSSKRKAEDKEWEEFNALLKDFELHGITCFCGDITEALASYESMEFYYIYFPKDLNAEGMYVDPTDNVDLREKAEKFFNSLKRDARYPCVLCNKLPIRHQFQDGGTVYYSVGCECKETKAYRSTTAQGEWDARLYKSTEKTPNEERPSWQERNHLPIIV